MPYIPFDTKAEATERTRVMWTDILGRDKYAQDVTEFLYGVVERSEEPDAPELPPGVDVAISIAERDAYLDTLIRADQLTDDELAVLVEVYPLWQSGVAYAVGDLCAYDDLLYMVLQAHTSQVDWTPDIVPALFVRKSPEGVIPEWIQPTGAHDAYALGALVTHNGLVWESLYPANVWEPGVFGWVQV